MSETPVIPKGFALEEFLRAYFLRAGFFVVRGVPLRVAEEDLTDVDLWLYERPTGTARRVQICDIKYKQKPKAVERILWTSGLAETLGVDGAYVATTDNRPSLRSIANKLNLQLIDGTDIRRIQSSAAILFPERMADEQLIAELQVVDKEFRNKDFQIARVDILSSLSEGFGAPSAVRALEAFCRLASSVVAYHPDSKAARVAGRLAYLAAALTSESLDYVSVSAAFKSMDERRKLILDAVRLGALSDERGQYSLKLAIALVEKYAPGGRGAARGIESALRKDLERIPAEIIADQAVKLLKSDQLFLTGRELEMACYAVALPTFDGLSVATKSMLGALLDYANVDRQRFANAWKPNGLAPAPNVQKATLAPHAESPQPSLFTEK